MSDTSSKTSPFIFLAIFFAFIIFVLCAVLFWISWSSMTSADQLREENRKLSLETAVCQLRIENTPLKPLVLSSQQQEQTVVPDEKKSETPKSLEKTEQKQEPASVEKRSGTVESAETKPAEIKPVESRLSEPVVVSAQNLGSEVVIVPLTQEGAADQENIRQETLQKKTMLWGVQVAAFKKLNTVRDFADQFSKDNQSKKDWNIGICKKSGVFMMLIYPASMDRTDALKLREQVKEYVPEAFVTKCPMQKLTQYKN